jgi:hypothetical protein
VLWSLRVPMLVVALVGTSLNACGPRSERPLATTTVSCQGYTARLLLKRQADPTHTLSPYVVQGARWQAEIEGIPSAPSLREVGPAVRVHLETFTIRGQQGIRDDTFDGEWRSLGSYFVQEGPIRLSDGFGELQTGDQGELFLTVMPPNISVLWTPHIRFRLRSHAQGPEVEEAWTAPATARPCQVE